MAHRGDGSQPLFHMGDGGHISVGGDVRVGGGSPGPVTALIVAVLAGLIVALATGQLHVPGREPTPEGGKTLTVDNRIPIGAHRNSEDKPLRLFTSAAVCRSSDCVIEGPAYYTGDKIAHAVCQTDGAWVTNSNMTTHADDRNPITASSRLWYGVKLSSDRMGFVSAVWVRRDERDGRSLPDCRSRIVQAS